MLIIASKFWYGTIDFNNFQLKPSYKWSENQPQPVSNIFLIL